MNSKILFANSVGYKINNYLIKKKVIDYLQNNVDIYKIKNNFILDENDLLTIKNENLSILPNIVGDDYIFVSIKHNGMYYAVLVEKNTLDFEDTNYNNLNIISIKIRLANKTYDGTIFDGRIVNLGGCCAFIINKIYKLKRLYIEIYLYKLYTLAQVWVPVADIGSCTKCTIFLYRKLISIR